MAPTFLPSNEAALHGVIMGVPADVMADTFPHHSVLPKRKLASLPTIHLLTLHGSPLMRFT